MTPWRRNLLLVLGASFLSLLGFNLVFPFLPLFVVQLGIHDAGQAALWSGFVISAASLTSIVIQPVWGYLADHRGRKPMLVRATIGAGAALLAMAWVRTVWHLLTLRGIFGALSGTNPAANAMIAASVPGPYLGMALGWLQTVSQLSAAIGPIVGGFIVVSIGLRGAFVAAGLVGLLAGATVIFGVRELAPAAGPMPVERVEVARVAQAPIYWGRLVAPLTALVAMILAVSLLSPTMPSLVGSVRHEPQAAGPTGVAFGLLGLTSAVAALTIGGPEHWFGRRGTLVGGALVAIVAEAILYTGHDWVLFLLGLALLGIGQGLVLPMGAAMLAARSDRSRLGAVFGIASSVQSIGFAGGPLLGGALAAGLGLQMVFPTGGLLLLLGVAPLFGGPVTRQVRVRLLHPG